jgi:hypothetical protein
MVVTGGIIVVTKYVTPVCISVGTAFAIPLKYAENSI